jgi:hypothetical protein
VYEIYGFCLKFDKRSKRMLKHSLWAVLSFSVMDLHAIVLSPSTMQASGHQKPESIQQAASSAGMGGDAKVEPTAFPFWGNIGTVGMGTGLYLGDGWVLTSTHVGCLPFVLSDGDVYRPIAGTWQPLKNADGSKSDLAVFQVNQGESDSDLRKLSAISISTDAVESQTPVLLVGTGYVEKKSAGEQKPVSFGAYQRSTREKRWALATTNEVSAPAATQGGLRTHCFATTFRAQAFGGQAAEGDSGGAAFVFDADERRWKLAGCIFAVSQVDAFVPYGARTYVGDLAVYGPQIDELACCAGGH